MFKVLFANHKGGCGKTTLSHHFACYLDEAGSSVLAIDTDSQANLYRRLAMAQYKPTECSPVNWGTSNSVCLLSPGSWSIPDGAQRRYGVLLVDTAPGDTLPKGPPADLVVVPVDGLDAALGAGNVIDAILDGYDDAPWILLVKNGTNEGGRRLQRKVTDLEGCPGVEICDVEVPRGGAVHRTSQTCKPAWQDVYRGSQDALAIRRVCQWMAERMGT